MDFYNVINNDYKTIIKSNFITPIIKIELLDDNENAYDELINEISAEQIGSINESYQQGVRKTINFNIFDPLGKFLPNPDNKFFWIRRKFKIYIGVQAIRYTLKDNLLVYSYFENDLINYLQQEGYNISIGNEDSLICKEYDNYWFSKGVFLITDISATKNESGNIVTINGVDKFGLFGSETGYNESVGTLVIPKGMQIGTIITTILNQDIGNKKILDPITPIIDPELISQSIPFEISKAPGSFLSDLLIELASTFKADIFYDNDGRLNLWTTMMGENFKNSPISWDFYNNDSFYISSTINFNLVETINQIFVIGDNPNAKIPPTAIVQNNNLSSPLCVQNIGIKSKYVENSNIQTAIEAEDYGKYLLKNYSVQNNNINFEICFLPHLKVDEIFSLTDNFYKFYKENFVISSLTFPLGVGTMQISGSNIKELPEL